MKTPLNSPHCIFFLQTHLHSRLCLPGSGGWGLRSVRNSSTLLLLSLHTSPLSSMGPLHKLHCEYLLLWGLSHGLQENPCSGVSSSLSFFFDLGICTAISHLFFSSPSLLAQCFCHFSLRFHRCTTGFTDGLSFGCVQHRTILHLFPERPPLLRKPCYLHPILKAKDINTYSIRNKKRHL